MLGSRSASINIQEVCGVTIFFLWVIRYLIFAFLPNSFSGAIIVGRSDSILETICLNMAVMDSGFVYMSNCKGLEAFL